jgi:peptidoglycan/LPS O-acetylase OafA/YrhL
MFLGLRIIRIFPALSVEVIISALVLGPIFTHFSLYEYFSNSMFWAYFLNVVGDVHFVLPGVFSNNPHPNVVNGQLWTVPYELYCYITLTLIALAGAVTRPWLVPAGAASISVAHIIQHLVRFGEWPSFVTGPVVGVMLVVCFLLGVTIFLYRYRLRFNSAMGLGALATSMLCVSWIPFGDYLAPWVVAYATVYLGLLNPPRNVAIRGADYSYGLFLYGYPIQQAIAGSGPWGRVWGVNFALTLTVGLLCAGFSWRFVEAPALSWRQSLSRLEAWWIVRPDNKGDEAKKKKTSAARVS